MKFDKFLHVLELLFLVAGMLITVNAVIEHDLFNLVLGVSLVLSAQFELAVRSRLERTRKSP